MSLQDKIKYLSANLSLEKPTYITNILQLDMLVENDLRNKNLFEIEDKSIIKLLFGDIPTFNDCAFRYYLFQFIYLYIIDNEYYSTIEDMFIQNFFESDILNKNKKRYLQFTNYEIEIILLFLKQQYQEIEKAIGDRDEYNKLELWEKEEIRVPFKGFELEIKDAILFWSNHPNYRNIEI